MSMSRFAPALLLGLALVASGCSGGGDASNNEGNATDAAATSAADSTGDDTAGASDATLSIYISEPQFLVPTNTNETEGSEVLNALFSPLVEINDKYEPVFGPDYPNTVAEEITPNDDATVWTIKLKDGWTFHNGEKVDAESYARAWNFGADPANAQNNSFFFEQIKGYAAMQEEGGPKELEGLKVVDDLTLEVTLERPFSPFLGMLGYTAFYPLPAVALEDIQAYESAPIGNGPLKMDGEWVHNESIKTVAYDKYPGDKLDFAGLDFQIYGDLNAAFQSLRAGSLDIMDALPPEELATVESEFGDKLWEGPGSSYTYLGFPLNDDRFKDPKIRQAMSMAIDRESINDAVWNGTRVPADDYVSPVVAGYRKGACNYCTYKPEDAKKLFDEAGGIDGPITVWFNSGAGHEEWVQAVANNWKQNLGIEEVKFESMQFSEYLGKLDSKEADGPFRLGWVADYPSMENYLTPILGEGGSSNYTGYSNPEFDKLIDEGNAAKTTEEAVKFYQQADDLAIEDMPQIPIIFSKKQAVSSERVSGLSVDFGDHVNLFKIRVSE